VAEAAQSQKGRRTGSHPGTEPDSTVKVLYTNAQSINCKLGELAAVAQESEPDIVLLTETWCNKATTNASQAPENYNLECDLRRDRSDTTAGIGGGLLVYSKQELCVLPIGKYDDNKFKQFCAF
jgi:hypothetical protein